jgi:putative tryptophan/tyrosine transport system substrate-binding protein
VTTRRSFLIALGAGALAVPRSSSAQPQSKVARIGFLYFGSRQSSLDTGRYNAFVQGMRELGYVEGTSFIIESRFAEGKTERLPALAAELIRLKVEIIVATGLPSYRALQHATSTIPIVCTVMADPVGNGFAASMARPGGNITGLATSADELGPKLLELLKAAVPKLSRVALLLQPENPGHPLRLKRVMFAAQRIGIQVVLTEAGTVQEIEREFGVMTKERAQAAIIFSDAFFLQESRAIATQALKHRLPSISANREYCEAGGLMSYGANLVENFRRAATYVDKILKGAKPGELPFEQPTRYQLTINGKTAVALGLTIPSTLLRQADEVIH